MDPVLAGITLATFIKELVELGRNIKDSIDQVGENKEQLSRLRDEVTGTLNGLVKLTQGFGNAQPSLELSTALEDLKSHLERIHNKSKKASQHTSWFKSWWNRQKIDQEVKRLNELKDDFYEQFTLFSTARVEGKADQIVDTTAQIQNTAVQITDTTTRTQATAVQIADTTTRIESTAVQITDTTTRTQATAVQIADTTTRIESTAVHITDTTTQIHATAVQIADTTTRLKAEAAQTTSTTAQIQTDIVQVASTSARIEDNTGFLTNTMSRIEQRTNEVQVSILKEKLEKWLEHPPNMKKRQDDTQELQHEGTGSWFLDGDQFKGWKEKPGSLWIRGDSGTGKSVLSSIVIRQLFSQRQHGTAIAYFYFDFRDEKSQRVKIMLQSIILQLSAQSPNSYSALEREFESSQGQTLPTYDKLLGILEELLSDFGHSYFILDALDECNEANRLVQFILPLRDWTTRSLHLLITSQPREIFMEAFKHASLVTLTPHITQNDIRRFTDSELLQLSHLTRCMGANEIVEKVVKKSNGMFRLAALLVMELRDTFNLDLDTILSSFPDDLFGVYSRFLKRIHPKAVFYVSTVLRWLAFSSQPVTMLELEDTLAFDFSNPSEFVYDPLRRGENADRVCKMLEGMIVVKEQRSWKEENTMVVALAHASVEDYFCSEKFGKEYPGYDLRFIDHPLTRETRTYYPLGPHAAENWYYHLGRSDDPALLSSLVVHLLQDGSNQYAAFNYFRLGFGSDFVFTKPLSICSLSGYTEAVSFLLQSGADPNMNDNGDTALIAASYAHLDIVRILLQSGAQVDTVALNQASTQRRWDIVQVLLQKSTFSVVREWITDELVIVLEDGGLEAVQILLEAWIHLGSTQVPPHHLVVIASERGQSDSLRLLLEYGADVNAADKEYNALCAASLNGHFDTIRVLLEKGAEVNAMSGRYGSALQAASVRGNIGICRLLVEHGAEVNTAGGRFGSALQAASVTGNMEIVRLLLENGAEVNTAGGEYGSALQAASVEGNLDICRLLLENGAGVNAAGGRFGSALQAASFGGNMEIVRLLIEHGTEVNAAGGEYGSALQVASRWGDIETVQLLVEHGAEVNTAGGEYGSPLQAASRGGNVEMVRLLLEKGAQVNTAGGRYGSALQAASIRGRVGSVQLLLEHGADVNATGGMHGSALQAASRNGHVDMVRLLLEKDADVNAISGPSGTALKAAARFDQLGGKNWWDAEEIIGILLENGAHKEDMTYGSEEDVDAHDSSSDSWSNAAAVSDNEDAMLD